MEAAVDFDIAKDQLVKVYKEWIPFIGTLFFRM
jgi:hypothetical protein